MTRPALHDDRSVLDARLTTTLAAFVAAHPPGADEDVHMVPAVVDHVIERLTQPGDVVLDPFAGFGTTLARAVALGRQAWGVELLPERVAYARQARWWSRVMPAPCWPSSPRACPGRRGLRSTSCSPRRRT